MFYDNPREHIRLEGMDFQRLHQTLPTLQQCHGYWPRGDLHMQNMPLGVRDNMTFTPLNFFSPINPSILSFFPCFRTL